jgi:hypothetical protein
MTSRKACRWCGSCCPLGALRFSFLQSAERFNQLRKDLPRLITPKLSKQRGELYGITLRSDPAVMPLSIKRYSASVWLIGALALLTVRVETYAQDLEPRAFANTPVGMNFLIGAYAYSKGTVGTDPSVPLTDTEVELNSVVLAYVRTLDLWGRSGKFDLIIPYTWADGSAKLAGQERTRLVVQAGSGNLQDLGTLDLGDLHRHTLLHRQ